MTREQAVLGFLDEVDGLRMHGFLLRLHGEPLAEGYWKPFCAERPHRMYSVSKSAVSLAVGILCGEGKLSLEDRIVPYFPEWARADMPPLLAEVTIRQMLMMSTCYDRAMYAPLVDLDWTKPFFYGQPTHVPGTLFHYDTSASQTLCALVERLTGRDILSFLRERLFVPLGMTGEMRWLKDGVGASQGGTGLVMTLRDLSLLADFCMSDGRGLVPQAYLREATSFQIDTSCRPGLEERYGYGYQFWRMRRGFAMYGLGGQMALCLPDEGLSLCTTADLMLDSTGVQPIYDAFFRHLAGIGTLEHSAEDAVRLHERLERLALRPVENNADTRAERWLTLADASLPFDALCVCETEVQLRMDGRIYALPYAVGGWAEGAFPMLEERCIASGGWVAPNQFTLLCELTGDNACGLEMRVSFRDGRGSVQLRGALWECAAGWDGVAWGYEERW